MREVLGGQTGKNKQTNNCNTKLHIIYYALSLQVGGKGQESVTGKQTRKRRHFNVWSGSEEGRRSSVRMTLKLLA